MRIPMTATFSFVLLVAAVIGCSSGNSTPLSVLKKSSASPINVASLLPMSARTVGVHFLIPEDLQEGSAVKRSPDYVSSSTLSGSVEVNGSPPPDVTDLSPSSASCTAAPGGGRDCTLMIAAPSGNDTFDVRLFDAANAGGNVLSRVSSTQAITDSTTSVSFTLNGVVSRVALAPLSISFPAGTATNVPIVLNAFDADSNLIIAPGGYVDANGNSIKFTVGYADPMSTSAASVIGTPPAAPGGSESLAYTGSSSLGGQITATVSGTTQVITSNVVPVTIKPTIIASATLPPNTAAYGMTVGSDHQLYLALYNSNSQAPSFGKLTSPAVITSLPIPAPSGALVPLPNGVVLGPDGRVWTTIGGGENAAIATSGAVTVYPFPTLTPSPLPNMTANPNSTPVPFSLGAGQLLSTGTKLNWFQLQPSVRLLSSK